MLTIPALLVFATLPQHAAPERDVEHEAYRAQMAAAESALRLGDIAEARAWLDTTQSAQRGLEWRLFDTTLDRSMAKRQIEKPAHAMAVSPDGQGIALGRSDGVLEWRDAETFELKRSVAAHSDAISQLNFDRTGTRIVTASHDRKVKVWNAQDLELLFEFSGHGYPVGGADFSADGQLIASCSYERPAGGVVGTLHLWNATDGSIVRTLHGGRKPLVGLAFSPDGARIAAGSWDFCAFVWKLDEEEPQKLSVPDEGIYNAVDGIAWSPDGTRLAAASKDKTARVWDVESGALIATLRGHTDSVTKVAYSPLGATMATSSADGTLKLWNAVDGSLQATLRGHADDVLAVAYASKDARLWSASTDGSVRAWDAETPWYDGAHAENSHATYVVRFSPGGERIACASYDGRISIWSSATLELLSAWQAHPENRSCHALDWTPDGRMLFSGSHDGTVALWNAFTQEELARFDFKESITWLAVSPDGKHVAIATGKTVHLWDTAQRKALHVLAGHEAGVLSVNWSSNSLRCVSCGRDGTARLWEAATGAALLEMRGVGRDVAEAVFTADGAEVIVAGRGGHVAVFDATNGTLKRDLIHNRHGVDHIALSPDGQRVVLASEALCFLDARHGGLVGRLRPHRDGCYFVAFDPTGQKLVSCSTDHSIALHDPRPLSACLLERERMIKQRALLLSTIEKPLADGASLANMLDSLFANQELERESRATWIEALTLAGAR